MKQTWSLMWSQAQGRTLLVSGMQKAPEEQGGEWGGRDG